MLPALFATRLICTCVIFAFSLANREAVSSRGSSSYQTCSNAQNPSSSQSYCFKEANIKMSEVDKFLAKFWEWRMVNSPEFATAIGEHKYDDRLDDYSLEAFEKRQKECEGFVKELESFNPDDLTEKDALNVNLLKQELQIFLDGSKRVKSNLLPVNNLEGPHLEFGRTLSWMKYNTLEDYDKYFARLSAFPNQVAQFIVLLREGIKTGYVYPRLSVKSVPDQLNNIIDSTFDGEELIYSPLKTFPEDFTEEQKKAIKEKGLKLIDEQVKPAYKSLLECFNKEYLPASRETIACSDFPDGKEYYLQALRFHITVDMTPQQVHDTGLEEAKRIRQRMGKIYKVVGYEGSFEEFIEHLKTDPKFFFNKSEEMVPAYKELCFNKIHPKLKDIFLKIPKAPFRIVETPKAGAASAPPAFYQGPSEDGSRPGTFYVNTYKPETRAKYDMGALALHEAEPGHHLQTAYAMEQEEQPGFRRFMEDRRYYEVPARFAMHTAYMEGWGLYSEFLGEELGIYEDPYSLFGRLSAEAWRAARLVVDTGIHALGWSRDMAVKFMKDNTLVNEHAINTEVDRYITWPGQACSYKIGEIKIRELRTRAETELRDKFDIKEFHEVFLSLGPVPLKILESEVDKYIESKQ